MNDTFYELLINHTPLPEKLAKSESMNVSIHIHSRYMKTQHMKFEILNEILSVFKFNLIQLNFVQNILVIGRICDTNFHPFGDVRDDVTRSLDVCHR